MGSWERSLNMRSPVSSSVSPRRDSILCHFSGESTEPSQFHRFCCTVNLLGQASMHQHCTAPEFWKFYKPVIAEFEGEYHV